MISIDSNIIALRIADLGPHAADDVLVERLARPEAQVEPAGIHRPDRGRRVGDHRGVVAKAGAGHRGTELEARPLPERAKERPGERALALLRRPRMEVLADHEAGLEAGALSLGAPVEQLGGMELLEHGRIADRRHRRPPRSAPAPSSATGPPLDCRGGGPSDPYRDPSARPGARRRAARSRRPGAGGSPRSRSSPAARAAAPGRRAGASTNSRSPASRCGTSRRRAALAGSCLGLDASGLRAAGRRRSGAARRRAGRGRARAAPSVAPADARHRRSSSLSPARSSQSRRSPDPVPAGTSSATTALRKSGWSVTPHGAVAYSARDARATRTPGRPASAPTAWASVAVGIAEVGAEADVGADASRPHDPSRPSP